MQIQAGAFHSLFCDGGDCFVVKGESLYRVSTDGTILLVRDGLTADAQVDFEQVGDRTYCTNGYEIGWIQEGFFREWEKGIYHGPDTTRAFSGPVTGNHIASFYGRMLISEYNALWWSEPYDFGLFNLAESFVQFHTKIRMVKPVAGGCFVSTEKNTYFLEGPNPKGWISKRVANYPALEWSAAIEYVDGMDVGMQSPGLCAVWASPEGAVLGTPGGQIINLTKPKVIYPNDASTGFGCLMGYSFIHGME